MHKNNRGFTLIELLVAIAIIGLLSILAVVAARYALNKAKLNKALYDCEAIHKAVQLLAHDTNEWPGNLSVNAVAAAEGSEICGDGCAFGLSDASAGIISTDGSYAGWDGPYMPKIELDPWGNEYFFDPRYLIRIDGAPCAGGAGCIPAVVIGSYGPDGEGNNQYGGDDIIRIIFR